MAKFDAVPRSLWRVMHETGPEPAGADPNGPSELPPRLHVQSAEPR